MNDTELAEHLGEWIKRHGKERNFWSRYKVAKIIFQLVSNRGNWKNAARGNPAKGLRVAMENKARREN